MSEIINELILIISFAWLIIILILCIKFIVNMLMQTIYWYWVPFVPSADNKVMELVKILKIKKWQSFLDLWCGDWKVLEAVKERFPEAFVSGIENSPKPFNLALKRRKNNNLDYTIIQNNFFKENFSKYDIIYSYLLWYLMKKIWIKVKAECKPWTLFYASEFEIKWEKFIDKIVIEKKDYKWKIFVYKV